MKVSTKAALLAIVLAIAVPAAQIPPAYAGKDRSAEELARLGLEQMLKAFEQFLGSIPLYAMPQILENGDIIIRRVPPRGERRDDDGGKKAKPADPHKLEETRA